MPTLQYADSYVNLSVSNITPKLLDAGHFDKFDQTNFLYISR